MQGTPRITNRVALSSLELREDLKDQGLPGTPHVERKAVEGVCTRPRGERERARVA